MLYFFYEQDEDQDVSKFEITPEEITEFTMLHTSQAPNYNFDYTILIRIYNQADDNFMKSEGVRYDKYQGFIQNFEKELESVNLSLVKYHLLENQEKGTIVYVRNMAMCYLVKANILLRQGQVLAQDFHDPQDYYYAADECLDKAMSWIQDTEETKRSDIHQDLLHIEMLVKLNQGKYFRNIAKYERNKVYYDKSLDAFMKQKETVKEHLEIEPNDTFLEHILIDLNVNIGRVYKNLYQFQEAYTSFHDVINIIFDNDEFSYLLSVMERHDEKEIETYLQDNLWIENSIRIREDEKTKSYALQIILNIGIIERKNERYKIAIEVFNFMLRIDKCNIDALNNLILCHRKSDSPLEIKYSNAKQAAKEIWNIIMNKNSLKDMKFLHNLRLCKNKKECKAAKDLLEEVEVEGNVTYRLVLCDHDACVSSKSISEEIQKVYVKENEICQVDSRMKINNRFTKIQLIKLDIMQGDVEKANATLENLLQQNSKDPSARLLKGCCLRVMGKYSEAVDVLTKLYKDFPNLDRGAFGLKANFELIKCYMALKRLHQAITICKKLLSKPEPEISVFFEYSECLRQMPLTTIEMIETFTAYMDMNQEKIEYNFSSKKLCKFYNNIGVCYIKIEEFAFAKPYFERILKINAGDVEALANNGICYLRDNDVDKLNGFMKKQNYKRAQESFKLALSLDPKNMDSNNYLVRCYYRLMVIEKPHNKDIYETEYYQQLCNHMQHSFRYFSLFACKHFIDLIDFVKLDNAYELKKIFENLSHILLDQREEGAKAFKTFSKTSEIARMHDVEKGELMYYLLKVYYYIAEVKRFCKNTLKANEKYVHYTNIQTLKKLLEAKEDRIPKFRLMNITYMNDLFEGEQFFTLLKQAVEVKTKGKKRQEKEKKYLDILSAFYPCFHLHKEHNTSAVFNKGNVYISSLSKVNDNLQMWIHYANQGKGCQIVFDREFFDISTAHSDEASSYVSLHEYDYPLYAVQYIDDMYHENAEFNTSTLRDNLHNIYQVLDDIVDFCEKDDLKQDHNKSNMIMKERIYAFVADRLNEIRFLFKTSEYAYEKEVRVIVYSELPKVDYDIKAIPQLYVEVERDIHMEEVQLGPKIIFSDANDLAAWLESTGKVKAVTKSKIHYK